MVHSTGLFLDETRIPGRKLVACLVRNFQRPPPPPRITQLITFSDRRAKESPSSLCGGPGICGRPRRRLRALGALNSELHHRRRGRPLCQLRAAGEREPGRWEGGITKFTRQSLDCCSATEQAAGRRWMSGPSHCPPDAECQFNGICNRQ